MKLDFNTYKDKVRACWIGKNIGGTMGGPYEHAREVLDIHGYSTPAGMPLPNDDLDLQLIWLYALEQVGPNAINASNLGEFWLSYITPHWNEYGICKANMRAGLTPPLAGDYLNDWCNSNGAWIRTEIWACVTPGLPAVTAEYAIEDAKVDHGAGEGSFAAAFVGAMQSAAFVSNDLRACIDVGLSAIPETCRTSKTVKLVLDSYDSGKTWLEARNAVLEQNMDLGNGWFEAPSNVGYTVIGLIYGEGDFKKSMITAINCGDDTDCTGATVGATMGILYGMAGIPQDWTDHIGDEIITISLALGGMIRRQVPKTCTELTERVVALAPHVLFAHSRHRKAVPMELGEGNDLPENALELMKTRIAETVRKDMDMLKPYAMRFETAFLRAELTLDAEPALTPGQDLGIHIHFSNNPHFENMQHSLNLRWILPEGFTVSGRSNVLLNRFDTHGNGDAEAEAVIHVGEAVAPGSRIILEVTVPGRHTALYASFPIFAKYREKTLQIL